MTSEFFFAPAYPTKAKFVFAHIRAAKVYAELSSCERLKVGTILVKNNTPIAIGYNGTKPGQDNRCEDEHGKTKPGVRHAEINALNKLWNSQETALGAHSFQTHAPCIECAQDLVHAGITFVFYELDYRSDEGIQFLKSKGVHVFQVNLDDETIVAK